MLLHYKIKSRLFNLGFVCVWVTGRTWLMSVINCYFVFFPLVLLPIILEPLGKQELIVNQSLMWDLQSPRKQNCFSLILHVFELRKQSLWTWLLGEPCYLAWLSRKGRSRRNKRKRCMSTSTHITGSHNNHLKKINKKNVKKRKEKKFPRCPSCSQHAQEGSYKCGPCVAKTQRLRDLFAHF